MLGVHVCARYMSSQHRILWVRNDKQQSGLCACACAHTGGATRGHDHTLAMVVGLMGAAAQTVHQAQTDKATAGRWFVCCNARIGRLIAGRWFVCWALMCLYLVHQVRTNKATAGKRLCLLPAP